MADRFYGLRAASFRSSSGVFADSGYAGEKIAKATLIAVEIVRKNPDQVGFAVQPRRWVVERFFAWIGRNRRLAKDFEATIDSARAFLYAASVTRTNRLSTFGQIGLLLSSIRARESLSLMTPGTGLGPSTALLWHGRLVVAPQGKFVRLPRSRRRCAY